MKSPRARALHQPRETECGTCRIAWPCPTVATLNGRIDVIEDVQLTLHQAAAEVGVKPQTIKTWIHRGYLAPIPGTKPQKFRLADVLEAEAGRNRKMRRKPVAR